MALTLRHFYHKGLRKVVTAFGSMFNQITVIRLNNSAAELSRERVSLIYSPKMRWVIRTEQDRLLEDPEAIHYPRMGFDIFSVRYASERALHPLQSHTQRDSTDVSYLKQYRGVPYDIDLNLYITAKTTDDANQIVEQILPFFTPDYAVEINAVPELGIKYKAIFTLLSVNFDDQYDGDFLQNRNITWTLQFTCKAFFFGPILQAEQIKKAITNIGLLPNMEKVTRIETIPVTDPPQPYYEITEDDDYGFSTTVTDLTATADDDTDTIIANTGSYFQSPGIVRFNAFRILIQPGQYTSTYQ